MTKCQINLGNSELIHCLELIKSSYGLKWYSRVKLNVTKYLKVGCLILLRFVDQSVSFPAYSLCIVWCCNDFMCLSVLPDYNSIY